METKKKDETPLKPIVISKYLKEDKELALRLFKTPSLHDGEAQQILQLYRRYVPGGTNMQIASNCGGCSNSLTKVFTGLRDWFGSNMDKFE